MRPDDDLLVIDQVIDRPNRGHRVMREYHPAQGYAAQQLPALAFGKLDGLPRLQGLRDLIMGSHNCSLHEGVHRVRPPECQRFMLMGAVAWVQGRKS